MKHTLFLLISFLLTAGLLCTRDFGFPTWKIIIKSAEGLQDTDVGKNDLTDPFVVLYAAEQIKNSEYHITEIGRTPVIENSLQPVWNFQIDFNPGNRHQDTDYFYLRVCDRDPLLNRDLLIGEHLVHYTHDALYTLSVGTSQVNILNLPRDRRMIFKTPKGNIQIFFSKRPPVLTVPDLTGKTRAEAETILQGSGLRLGTVNYSQTPDSAKNGKVISQNPLPGKTAYYYPLNRSCVMVSLGQSSNSTVPALVGGSLYEAKLLISGKGFSLGTVSYTETADVSRNLMVSLQDPPPGSVVPSGSAINLTVFQFKQPEPVEFPEVIGLSYIEAVRAIRKAGLKTGSTSRMPVEKEKDSVIRTIPDRKKNPKLLPGSVVSLFVAAPELIGTSLAFPIDRKPGENIALNFAQSTSYYIRISSDQKGYVRFLSPEGSEALPLDGEFFDENLSSRGSYSNWYANRVMRILKGTCFMHFSPDPMSPLKKDGATVNLYYEILPEMDSAEPNDSRETAALLSTGMTTEIALYPKGDKDWFSWRADADGYLRFRMMEVPASINIMEIDVWSGDNRINSVRNPGLSVKVYKDQQYFIELGCAGGASDKAFKIIPDFMPEMDVYEPNDTFETAASINGSTSGCFYFQGQGEQEFFKLHPPEWAKYLVFSTKHSHPHISPRFFFGADLKEIGQSVTVPSLGRTSAIPVAGDKIIYLRSDNEFDHAYSDEPIYFNFEFHPGKAGPDFGDSFDTAFEMKGHRSPEFAIAPNGDIDFFKFRIEQPGTYYISTGPLSPIPLKSVFFDQARNELASFVMACGNEHNRVSFSSSGYYYLSVRGDYSMDSSAVEMTFQIARQPGVMSVESKGVQAPPAGKDKQTARDLAVKGLAALQAEKYEESRSLFQRAADLDQDPRYFHDLGIACYKMKKLTDAEKFFRKAIALDSEYYLAYKSLGAVLGDLEKFDESLEIFKAAEMLNGQDPMLYYNFARTYELMFKKDRTRIDMINHALDCSGKAWTMDNANKDVENQLKRLRNYGFEK